MEKFQRVNIPLKKETHRLAKAKAALCGKLLKDHLREIIEKEIHKTPSKGKK